MQDGIKPEYSEYLEIAKSSADLLLFLANDMLDYAQLEAGKLRLTYSIFNVNSTLHNLISLLNFKA